MTHPRQITVFVDEADPGHFHWVLHESTEGASVWVDIQSSTESFTNWMEAFDAGCVELFKLVPENSRGLDRRAKTKTPTGSGDEIGVDRPTEKDPALVPLETGSPTPPRAHGRTGGAARR